MTGYPSATTLLELTTLRLSVAVRATDAFTGTTALVGDTAVTIQETGQRAARNPSGYFVFTGLTLPGFTLRADNRCYLPAEQAVDAAALDPRAPVVPMTLVPGALYPFPGGATLVRGTVRQADGSAAADAQVSAGGASTRTGADGTFVLYWGPLREEDVSTLDGRRYLQWGQDTDIVLTVAHPSFPSRTVPLGRVAEGELTLLTSPVTLTP